MPAEPTSLSVIIDDRRRRGYSAVEMAGLTGVATIKAGSVIEIKGQLYKFDNDEAVGEPEGESSYAYLYMVRSESGTNVRGEWSTSAPQWMPEQNGWHSPLNENWRAIGQRTPTRAWLYPQLQGDHITAGAVTVTGDVVPLQGVQLMNAFDSGTADTDANELYDFLSPFVPETGVRVRLTGSFDGGNYMPFAVERQNTTTLNLLLFDDGHRSASHVSVSITDGDSTTDYDPTVLLL